MLQISKQDFEQLDIEMCKSLVYDALATKQHPTLYCDNFEILSNELEEKKGGKDIKEIFNFLNNENNELPSNTSILVTSRNVKNFLSNEKRIDLEGLKIDEGMKVFIKHASTYQQHFSDRDNKETKLLRTLITKTGGHPLSIEILAKTYEGGGETELQKMSETLGQQRDNPWGSVERHENLHKCFNYSIERLDKSLQMLLPTLTIFHSPFPSQAVEQTFEIQESGQLLVALYNKSLLSKMERDDEYGSFSSSKFWLYSIHLALRNYLEDTYKDSILNVETKSIPYFCNYYYNLVRKTYDAWGKDDHKDLIRQFVQMTKSENNDYERAIEYATNIKEEKLKQIGAGIASYLGLLYDNLGYYDRSLVYQNNALKINEALRDRNGMARGYNNIGMIYFHKGQLDDALQYYNKALEIDEKLGDQVGKAKDYSNMGMVYYKKGQLDDALQYYSKALEIHKELENRIGMSADYTNIGLIYYKKDQLDDALQYHKKALEIDEKLGDQVGKAKDYSNMGMGYHYKGQLDDALQYYNKALEIQQELGDQVGMAADYNNIGMIYFDKGQLDDALQYYNKALEIGEQLGDIVSLVRDYCNIGYAYIAKKNKNEAALAANKALKIVTEFESKTGQKHPRVNMVKALFSSLS